MREVRTGGSIEAANGSLSRGEGGKRPFSGLLSDDGDKSKLKDSVRRRSSENLERNISFCAGGVDRPREYDDTLS